MFTATYWVLLLILGLLSLDLVNPVFIAIGLPAMPWYAEFVCAVAIFAIPLWLIGKRIWQRLYPGLPVSSQTKDIVFWHLTNYPADKKEVAQQLYNIQNVLKRADAKWYEIKEVIDHFVNHEASRLGIHTKPLTKTTSQNKIFADRILQRASSVTEQAEEVIKYETITQHKREYILELAQRAINYPDTAWDCQFWATDTVTSWEKTLQDADLWDHPNRTTDEFNLKRLFTKSLVQLSANSRNQDLLHSLSTHLATEGFTLIRNILEERVQGGVNAAYELAEALHNLPLEPNNDFRVELVCKRLKVFIETYPNLRSHLHWSITTVDTFQKEKQ
tara:strand:- start:3706 stop:4701 length:996 start_codon:yes stop_codon:yes gene_type:complete